MNKNFLIEEYKFDLKKEKCEINITFKINENGILSLSAKDNENNNNIIINNSNNIFSNEKIEKLIRREEKFIKREEKIWERNKIF